MPLRPLLVVGTRAEAIKMAPLALACAGRPRQFAASLCLTGQHRELADDVLAHFQLRADFDLNAMEPDQSLARLTARLVERLDRLMADVEPDYVVAVGDTTSVLAASLAAFYRRRPLVHVEAGLRTDDLNAPWPEEFNRRVASISAALHCAATPAAAARLEQEGVAPRDIRVTGNTAIDALRWTLERPPVEGSLVGPAALDAIAGTMLLVTCHRRESFGPTLDGIVRAIAELATRLPEVLFCWPVHPNPRVQAAVRPLVAAPNVWLLPPAPYGGFVELMRRASLILTDSGGVQEEAPTLGVPCLVLRDTTERPEAIACGANELVGTAPAAIVARTLARLRASDAARPGAMNPYGDGHAAARILDWMLERAAAPAPHRGQPA